jgi:hypothetical protein
MGTPRSSFAGSELRAVQRMLRETTEVLARELVEPGARAPSWSASEWAVARAAAVMHGLPGLLGERLRWRGPGDWGDFLGAQRAQIVARLARIQALLAAIDAGARAEGISLIALKGAALHARGIYRVGERPMADIDLLVAPAQEAQAGRLIERLGYHEACVTWKHREFHPLHGQRHAASFGEDADNPLRIELHAGIRELLPRRPVDISPLVLPQRLPPGVNDYASTGALLLHIVLHAAGAMLNHTLRFLHLHDIARVVQRMTPKDWSDTLAAAADGPDPSLWWAFPPLVLAHRYHGGVPEEVLARTAAGCSPLLRRLARRRLVSDVSLSYLWISAFPGIEWSRSLSEAAAYARSRVLPSPETRALRRSYAAAQPLVSGGDWAQASQARRIVRYLTSRHVRQETVQPVLRALERWG